MNTTRISRLVAVLTLALAVCAPVAAEKPADEKPEVILDRINAAQRQLKTLKARLTEKRVWVAFGDEETREAWVYIQRGKGVRLEFDGDDAQIIVATPTAAEIYSPRKSQLERFVFPEPVDDSEGLLPFLRTSKVTEGLERVADEELECIALTPTAPEGEARLYIRQELCVDATDWLPRRVTLTDETEDLHIYSFSQVERDPSLDPELFQLKVPQGTEIIEHQKDFAF